MRGMQWGLTASIPGCQSVSSDEPRAALPTGDGTAYFTDGCAHVSKLWPGALKRTPPAKVTSSVVVNL
ncbi:unnamed protein product [Merluccius merluccius]